MTIKFVIGKDASAEDFELAVALAERRLYFIRWLLGGVLTLGCLFLLAGVASSGLGDWGARLLFGLLWSMSVYFEKYASKNGALFARQHKRVRVASQDVYLTATGGFDE